MARVFTCVMFCNLSYAAGYTRATSEWGKQCHGITRDFPLDKMSKKCLKQLRVSLHPDKFECYEVIRDFYVNLQEKYDKKK